MAIFFKRVLVSEELFLEKKLRKENESILINSIIFKVLILEILYGI